YRGIQMYVFKSIFGCSHAHWRGCVFYFQNPFYHCLVTEVSKEHKSKEGKNYIRNTWKLRGIYIDDIYVMPEFRAVSHGIGKALMASVAKCGPLRFSVLNRNKPLLDFFSRSSGHDS
uniref:N-acetyltransferase domain-containing protein n=1 Tax=Electrophorus electricus TaxID=8005 RepID=A0A4W4ERH5_ELEEL